MNKVVILAAHDDGVGAHTTMCRVRDGIISALRSADKNNYFFLYLNGGAFGTPFLSSYWDGGNKDVWGYSSEPVNPRTQDAKLKGVWQKSRNFLKFVKAKNGSLDAPGTRKALRETITGYDNWAYQLSEVKASEVVLAIEMGVPQLNKWAAESDVRRIAVGDTFWSRTLIGSLRGAGEYDQETEKLVRKIAEQEHQTNEAWLIPLLAPRSYADFLSEMKVIYHYLPGFVGQPPKQDEIQSCKQQIGLMEGQKLIVMAAGRTKVWQEIYDRLAEAFRQRPDEGVALAYPSEEKGEDKIAIIEKGAPRSIPNPDNLIALFANADLGVTRGGVTIPEFISVGLPFAVVQEPNHWLSQNQQAAASEEGLCYTAGLSVFQDPQAATDLLISWVRDQANNQILKQRYAMYEFGVEYKLGRHLVERFL